jgi:hypothetical protein
MWPRKSGICEKGGQHEFLMVHDYFVKHPEASLVMCGIVFCDKCGRSPEDCCLQFPAYTEEEIKEMEKQ